MEDRQSVGGGRIAAIDVAAVFITKTERERKRKAVATAAAAAVVSVGVEEAAHASRFD